MTPHIKLYEPVSVEQVASAIGIKSYKVIVELMQIDVFKNRSATLSDDEIHYLGRRFEVSLQVCSSDDLDDDAGGLNNCFRRY